MCPPSPLRDLAKEKTGFKSTGGRFAPKLGAVTIAKFSSLTKELKMMCRYQFWLWAAGKRDQGRGCPSSHSLITTTRFIFPLLAFSPATHVIPQ